MSNNLLGPNYSYADELAAPSELGIRRDGSFDGIMRAVGGINYYVDAIGFGESTMIARDMGLNQKPLGVRYFMKTGQECSNGADMYEYINTVPPGLSGRIGNEVKNALGVDMKGLAPGIVSDAAGALNPLPMFTAVIEGGYPQCKKVTLPVGDMRNRVRSDYNPANVWIDQPVQMRGGEPTQTRWVLDKYISQEAWDAAAKTEKAGVLPEGFEDYGARNTIVAGALFAVVALGLMATVAARQ
jgi:hypothetical protein